MDFSYLWNDLPKDERIRLMPYSVQCHIRHIEQAQRMACKAHKAYLVESNALISDLERDLARYESDRIKPKD